MSQGVHLRKYGVETTVDFELYEVDGVDLRTDWSPAQADCEIMKDEGASTMCDNTATDEGSTYSLVLTATEMEYARGVLKIVDAATKVFLDKVIIIETYGNASAMHAMDFDDADGSTLTETGGDGAQLTEAGGDGDHLVEAGGDGDHLTAINLPNQTMDITGSITGNLSGTVGSVTGAVGSVAGNVDGDVSGNVTGTVAGKTPSEAGDAMNLAADAIKAVSYDESTAFPVKADDAGATQIARVGADSDTLETLSDQIDTAQADLDIITGADGTTLATSQGNYAPAKLADEVDNDGTAISLSGAMKLILAVLTGKSSGGGGATIVFRDINDAKNRISATVDANGNRTAVGTRDAT